MKSESRVISNPRITNSFLISICCLPLALLVVFSIHRDHAILAYTLDDPYIHLELAKNIFNGNYGINVHEFSSPSSSILWPLILAPFSIFEWYIYAPLLLNTIFLGLTVAFLLTHIFRDVESNFERVLIVTAIAFSLNLYGLVMTGMEHSLQVLCSAIIAFGLFNKEFRRSQILLFHFALVIAPLIRYESLAITVPVMLYLMSFNQDRRAALVSAIVLIVLLGGFSLFLFEHSGYYFPSSVMIKQAALSEPDTMRTAKTLADNIYCQVSKYGWLVGSITFALIIARVNVKLVITCTAVAFLYLALGKHGWFGRYEVFFVMFALIAFLSIVRENFEPTKRAVIFGSSLLPIVFGSLAISTLLTPMASSNIYNQQYLISQFVKGLNEPVAVNDLGLISLYSNETVVDLWGLGNLEAMASRKHNDPRYVDRLMRKNDARYAIIYREWFSDEHLRNLVLVGSLTLNEMRITPAEDTVSFYADSSTSAEALKASLKEFDFEDNSLSLVDALK